MKIQSLGFIFVHFEIKFVFFGFNHNSTWFCVIFFQLTIIKIWNMVMNFILTSNI